MKHQTTQAFERLTNFKPISALWEGESPIYPSEQSARWALRAIKGRLAQAGAIACHCGRLQVDMQKVSEIAREVAIEKARQRYGV